MSKRNLAMTIVRALPALLATGLMSGLLIGCKPAPKAVVYEVAKDPVSALPPKPTMPPAAPMPILPGMAEAAAGMERPQWKVPISWLAEPLDNLRQGSWKVEGPQNSSAEITVLAFPGDVGGDLANVNRWRSQIGLTEWDETTYLAHSKKMEIDGSDCTWVVLDEPASAHKEAIAAVIMPKGPNTWFFKLKGDRAAVEAQLESFRDFVLTVNFDY